MALWDPEAAGNAAKYLRLDDITLIDIRNAPFEGRTACWIPYAETGYTKGKKTGKEETDEKTKVHFSKHLLIGQQIRNSIMAMLKFVFRSRKLKSKDLSMAK